MTQCDGCAKWDPDSSPIRAVLPGGASFDEVVVPHLDAAHRLARWLMRNEHDADDVVQDASMRALRYFSTFRGGDGRAWFLQIVRNTCWSWHARRTDRQTDVFDEQHHRGSAPALDPEMLVLRTANAKLLDRALHSLPDRFRHLLVLREREGLSYREIAQESGVPIGTVMSRLSRAREALRVALCDQLKAPCVDEAHVPREEEDALLVQIA